MRALVLSLLSLVSCVRTSVATTPAAPPPSASTPVATPDAAPSGWWCYTGRYPGAALTSSRCMRAQEECDRWRTDVESDGYEADTERCFRLEVAHCTAFPTGAELCRTKVEHCEAARRIFSGRPGRPADVPACTDRS